MVLLAVGGHAPPSPPPGYVLPGSHLSTSSRNGRTGVRQVADLIPSCVLSCEPV